MAAVYPRLHISRRQVLQGAAAAGIGLLAGCGNPFVQPPPQKVHRIGFIATYPQPYDETFFQSLRELGYVDGQHITVERRYGEGNAQLHDLAAELVQLRPDVLVAVGAPAISAAQQVTQEIPIVMPFSGDPVRQGYVASLARPGGNITGLTTLSSSAISGKRLQLLQDAIPSVVRVAVLWNPDNPAKVFELNEMGVAARALGVQLEASEVRSRDDFQAAFAAIARQRPEALVILQDPLTGAYRAGIADFAIQQRVPAISELREFAEAGLLMSYGPVVSDLLRRAAAFVDRILKGAKPADLPVEQPREFEFVINLKTAEALGLTIPERVLIQAAEVIQ